MVTRLMTAACVVFAFGIGSAVSGDKRHVDPYHSELWPDLKEAYLGDGEVIFDRSMRVILPKRVEEAHNVPVAIKLSGDRSLIEEIVVIAEHNPIQEVLRLRPHRAVESLALNIRLEKTTPVRAAVRKTDGIWYVATTSAVLMSGGGCTSPNDGATASNIGQIALKKFERVGGASRLRIKINHPMDTGFAEHEDGSPIPAYYIDSVMISDDTGPVAEMQTSAALASDPTITLDLPDTHQSLRISASDSEGSAFEYFDEPPAM